MYLKIGMNSNVKQKLNFWMCFFSFTSQSKYSKSSAQFHLVWPNVKSLVGGVLFFFFGFNFLGLGCVRAVMRQRTVLMGVFLTLIDSLDGEQRLQRAEGLHVKRLC